MTTIHIIENPFPNVPLPAGAHLVEDWVDVGTDSPSRYFEGLHRVVERGAPDPGEPIHVYIAGAQTPDGRLEPIEIVVHQLHADEPIMSAATARQLARALIAAADGFDGLT
jgi:hypothetical protein